MFQCVNLLWILQKLNTSFPMHFVHLIYSIFFLLCFAFKFCFCCFWFVVQQIGREGLWSCVLLLGKSTLSTTRKCEFSKDSTWLKCSHDQGGWSFWLKVYGMKYINYFLLNIWLKWLFWPCDKSNMGESRNKYTTKVAMNSHNHIFTHKYKKV